MHSSSGSAASRRAESGTLMTGLPATVKSIAIWPSPGVAISSARKAAGTCPSTSGTPETRDFHRPNRGAPSLAVDAIHAIGQAIGLPHIRPPGRSNLPTTMFTTSTSHEASVPNSWLHSPMRPYSAPEGAAANSRASRRIVSAGTRQNASTDSGVNSAHSSRTVVEALDLLLECTERGQVLGEEDVAHREQERGVGARQDRYPLVGVVGGAGAARVDDDDLAATRPDAVELAEHVRAREQRTARRLRVASHADQVVGPLDVG